jgi:succinoglycan biosynthesis protein ExoA
MNRPNRIVSLIVPCRNERDYIESFVANAMSLSVPAGWSKEILIADGCSDDGTDGVLGRLSETFPELLVLANPEKIVSTGLNVCLSRAAGEIIVRLDVHTSYEADYVLRCIEVISDTGADVVGGPWRAKAEESSQQAMVLAFQSRAMSGGAVSRDINYTGSADTVYLGAWPASTFERFGNFDPRLVRNQDDEHNLRVTLGGGKVWQDSSIRSSYHPRSSLSKCYRQFFQYGYWKPFVIRKHGMPAKVRHLVPSIAVVGFLALVVLGLFFHPLLATAVVLSALYVVLLLGVALLACGAKHFKHILRVVLALACQHAGYGFGSISGWVRILRGDTAGPSNMRLTR